VEAQLLLNHCFQILAAVLVAIKKYNVFHITLNGDLSAFLLHFFEKVLDMTLQQFTKQVLSGIEAHFSAM
jgi:hypothetical protein